MTGLSQSFSRSWISSSLRPEHECRFWLLRDHVVSSYSLSRLCGNAIGAPVCRILAS